MSVTVRRRSSAQGFLRDADFAVLILMFFSRKSFARYGDLILIDYFQAKRGAPMVAEWVSVLTE